MILRTLDEPPVLIKAIRPQTSAEASHVKRTLIWVSCAADHTSNGDAEAVCQSGIEPGACGRKCHDVRIDAPILCFIKRARPVIVHRRREILAEPPAVRCAIVVDDAHLIVAEAIHPVFIKEESCIVDQELSNLGFAKVKNESAGMPFLEKVKRVPVAAFDRLTIEKIETLIAKIAAGMVVNGVQKHRQSVDVADVDQGFELIHLSAKIFKPVMLQAPRI